MGDQRVPHVLIVEPDKLLARTYITALHSSGISAECQLSAQQAINSMDSRRPDLVFLEVQMPEHNGVEFLYEIRSYPDFREIPVVLLTLVPESELGLTEEVKRRLGIVEYYYKPRTTLIRICETAQKYSETKV